MEPANAVPLIVIGLGSNLGDRRAMIDAAIEAMSATPGVALVGCSSVWQSAPMGGGGPDYYNAAVAVQTTLPPEQLLAALLAIEAKLGRVRSERNAPRTIDLDLLWMQDAPPLERRQPSWPDVVLPHPRLRERAFALIPLLELVPDAVDPVSGRLYAEILAEVGTSGVDPAPF
jgi:2-amino-4-hydroxy-6-hydroxymethyldihydropteridine diphosphokinase